jgi:ribonuclease VapC
MTIFADASALVAMIAGEPDADDLADRLEADPVRLISAIATWETVAGLCRSFAISPDRARARTLRFAGEAGLDIVGIGAEEARLATEAYARFGKGRHPAALNMGDCFAYACARANAARLLFKGNDFSQTDIPAA